MNIEAIKAKISYLSTSAQRAIVASALDILPGTTFVSEKKAEERLALCEECEIFESTTRKCEECGCFVDEKTRVKKLPFVEAERCPLNKWT